MKRYRGLAALGAALLIVAGGWILIRTQQSSGAKPADARRPWNTTHEKAFLNEQLAEHPKHAPILLRLAQIERGEGNLKDARRHLEQALGADGDQVEIRLELGLVCSEMGDLAEAESQNRELLRIAPGQTDALYNLGAIYANRGDYAQARKYWTEAVQRGSTTEGAANARKALDRLGRMP